MSQTTPDDLERYRILIDDLDRKLLDLLNQRTEVVENIGRIKQELGLNIYEPKREEQVFANVLNHNTGPLPGEAVKRIFERIIDEMRTVQKLNMRAQQPPPAEKESC